MKRNIKLVLAYEGTRYKGFQRLGQEELTIQAKLEACLSRLLEEEILVIGASRTDAGVHALAQIVNFHTTNPLSLDEIHQALNKFLPEDIIVQTIEEVDANFHSRYFIDQKTYLYRIHTASIPPLFERRFVYNLGKPLNLEKMKQAATLFVGTHDFQGFCKRKMKKSTIRTIYQVMFKQTESEIQVFITADGFLYNMVRIMIGTLIEIGLESREINTITEILEMGIRAEAGYLVPASGLILYENVLKTDKL
jgi:tRNA pseudouridine38-40 synthase